MRRAVCVALLALAACKAEKAPAPPKQAVAELAEPARPAELARVTIKALGMYCEESCPLRVRYALADNKAVYELGFDTANESIFVSYDKTLGSAKDVTKPMLNAIKEAGYDPWLAKESWPEDA
ncbi:MAG: hypothetical protein HOV81_31015, partial [Kofleriaceae bacterium]|nr:hypothetical protein [Kofleriaceae bacterium]